MHLHLADYHIIRIMWYRALRHPIQRPAVLCAGVHGVDARGVDATLSQQIGQSQQVFFRPVKGAGKQMAQIVGEHLGWRDIRRRTECLHLLPDIRAVKGSATPGHKHTAGFDAGFFYIPPQKAAEGAGQEDETHLAIALWRGSFPPAAAGLQSHQAIPYSPCSVSSVCFFIILPGDCFTIRKCRGCFDRTAEKKKPGAGNGQPDGRRAGAMISVRKF